MDWLKLAALETYTIRNGFLLNACRTNRKTKQLRKHSLTVVCLLLEVIIVVNIIPAILYLFSPVALSNMNPTRPVN